MKAPKTTSAPQAVLLVQQLSFFLPDEEVCGKHKGRSACTKNTQVNRKLGHVQEI